MFGSSRLFRRQRSQCAQGRWSIALLPVLAGAFLLLACAQDGDDILPAAAAPMLDASKLADSFLAGTVGSLLLEHLEVVVAPGKALPMVLTVEVFSGEGESLAKIRGPLLDLASVVGGSRVPRTDEYLPLPVAHMLPGGPDATSVSERFQLLPLFPSDTPLTGRLSRTSVEPSTGAIDFDDISWPFEAGEDVKLLLIHVLPDFSLPPGVRVPEVGGGFSYSAIGLVIFLWPTES